jgi:tripartite ATP-independent transporter DctP family solute receptor
VGEQPPLAHPSTIRAKKPPEDPRGIQRRVDIRSSPTTSSAATPRCWRSCARRDRHLSLSGLILDAGPGRRHQRHSFAFKDYATVWAAMDGELGALIRAANAKAGLHTFEKCLDNGYRNVTTNTRPIATPADLAGFKIRVPVGPLWSSLFRALGAVPTSMDFSEVYAALQRGVVDGQENPLSIIQLARLYEVQKHCSMTGHLWDGQWVLANGKTWAGMPKDLQAIVTKNVNEAVAAQRADMTKLNAHVAADLKAKGMAFNYPAPAPFRDALVKAGFYKEWKSTFGADAWETLEKYSGPLLSEAQPGRSAGRARVSSRARRRSSAGPSRLMTARCRAAAIPIVGWGRRAQRPKSPFPAVFLRQETCVEPETASIRWSSPPAPPGTRARAARVARLRLPQRFPAKPDYQPVGSLPVLPCGPARIRSPSSRRKRRQFVAKSSFLVPRSRRSCVFQSPPKPRPRRAKKSRSLFGGPGFFRWRRLHVDSSTSPACPKRQRLAVAAQPRRCPAWRCHASGASARTGWRRCYGVDGSSDQARKRRNGTFCNVVSRRTKRNSLRTRPRAAKCNTQRRRIPACARS